VLTAWQRRRLNHAQASNYKNSFHANGRTHKCAMGKLKETASPGRKHLDLPILGSKTFRICIRHGRPLDRSQNQANKYPDSRHLATRQQFQHSRGVKNRGIGTVPSRLLHQPPRSNGWLASTDAVDVLFWRQQLLQFSITSVMHTTCAANL
jgi:hypothetical protein